MKFALTGIEGLNMANDGVASLQQQFGMVDESVDKHLVVALRSLWRAIVSALHTRLRYPDAGQHRVR